MINLGAKVKDTLTGFSGIAFERVDFQYGCSHIVIEPTELKDGKPQERHSFDEQRIEEIEPGQPFVMPADYNKIPLGSVATDSITGFTGIATARAINLFGYVYISLTAQKLHEGNVIDSTYFHIGRLSLVEERKPTVSPKAEATSGGPAPGPVARSDRR